jgi:hypothetical protein
MTVQILLRSAGKFSDITQTIGEMSALTRTLQCRKQNRRKNGNNGNDYEEFYQGKAKVLYLPMGKIFYLH